MIRSQMVCYRLCIILLAYGVATVYAAEEKVRIVPHAQLVRRAIKASGNVASLDPRICSCRVYNAGRQQMCNLIASPANGTNSHLIVLVFQQPASSVEVGGEVAISTEVALPNREYDEFFGLARRICNYVCGHIGQKPTNIILDAVEMKGSIWTDEVW